jgi:hypothetical protein
MAIVPFGGGGVVAGIAARCNATGQRVTPARLRARHHGRGTGCRGVNRNRLSPQLRGRHRQRRRAARRGRSRDLVASSVVVEVPEVEAALRLMNACTGSPRARGRRTGCRRAGPKGRKSPASSPAPASTSPRLHHGGRSRP